MNFSNQLYSYTCKHKPYSGVTEFVKKRPHMHIMTSTVSPPSDNFINMLMNHHCTTTK